MKYHPRFTFSLGENDFAGFFGMAGPTEQTNIAKATEPTDIYAIEEESSEYDDYEEFEEVNTQVYYLLIIL